MEYIAFLRFEDICEDNTNKYATIWPVDNVSCNRDGGKRTRPFLIFPVINGKVDDSGASLQLGDNLSVIEYKQKLRAAINILKNP
jgi:hypothetical protein